MIEKIRLDSGEMDDYKEREIEKKAYHLHNNYFLFFLMFQFDDF